MLHESFAASPTEPNLTRSHPAETLEMRIDARRWRQVRAICRRLAGRELSDAECLTMVTEHYLMQRGLHTR